MILFFNSLKSLKRTAFKAASACSGLTNNGIRLCTTDVKAVAKIRLVGGSFRRKKYDFGSWVLLVIPVSSFGLGVWQIFRKIEKDTLIEKLMEKTKQPVVDLPQDLSVLKDMEFCSVRVKGKFDYSKEIYMGPRPLIEADSLSKPLSLLSNTRGGYLVITPFILSDRNLTILVNRGWVPSRRKKPVISPENRISEEVEFIGLVRGNQVRKPMGAKNYPHEGIWVYRDLEKMSKVTGAAPVFIDAIESISGPEGPIGKQTVVQFQNDHVSYILTWFTLSILSAYLWYLRHLRKLRVKV